MLSQRPVAILVEREEGRGKRGEGRGEEGGEDGTGEERSEIRA